MFLLEAYKTERLFFWIWSNNDIFVLFCAIMIIDEDFIERPFLVRQCGVKSITEKIFCSTEFLIVPTQSKLGNSCSTSCITIILPLSNKQNRK